MACWFRLSFFLCVCLCSLTDGQFVCHVGFVILCFCVLFGSCLVVSNRIARKDPSPKCSDFNNTPCLKTKTKTSTLKNKAKTKTTGLKTKTKTKTSTLKTKAKTKTTGLQTKTKTKTPHSHCQHSCYFFLGNVQINHFDNLCHNDTISQFRLS